MIRSFVPLLLLPLLLPLVLLLLLLPHATRAHFADPSVAAFPIRLVQSSSHTVRLPSPSKTTCTFTYETKPFVIEVPDSPTGTAFDLQGWLDAQQSSTGDSTDCATIVKDWWDYTVCFGSNARQHKGTDTFRLGEKPVIALQGTALQYNGGDECRAGDFAGPRESIVKFSCDPQASTAPRLVQVQETSTCHYEFIVATSVVCQDPRFAAVVSGLSAEQSSSEDWFLEINALHGDADQEQELGPNDEAEEEDEEHQVDVVCTVYSLEARALHSELNFDSFSLTIDKGKGVKSSDVAPKSRNQMPLPHSKMNHAPIVVARHPGRLVMQTSELQVTLSDSAHTVQDSKYFNGQLSFVKLYA